MSIQTKSATGIEVTLTGIEYLGAPVVRVEFTHPAKGKLSYTSTTYGEVPGPKGPVSGVIGWDGGQKVIATVPRADFDAALAEARSIGEREVEALKSGATPIRLYFSDGEYLSGHAAHGRAGKLLVELGLAAEVSGWGVHVERRVVDALGETFTYAAAAELARPALEAKREKANAAAATRQAIFDQARATGAKVELGHWSDDCCERNFDCSLDIVTEWAMPDGTTKTTRIHTH